MKNLLSLIEGFHHNRFGSAEKAVPVELFRQWKPSKVGRVGKGMRKRVGVLGRRVDLAGGCSHPPIQADGKARGKGLVR